MDDEWTVDGAPGRERRERGAVRPDDAGDGGQKPTEHTMTRSDCARCGTTVSDTTPRMQVDVVLMGGRSGSNEILTKLYLCDRCSDEAEDALSLETTIVAPRRQSPKG